MNALPALGNSKPRWNMQGVRMAEFQKEI